MSRASAAVRFPDGTVRAGIYNGTVDHLWPWLFDTLDEAWDHYDAYYRGVDNGVTVRDWNEAPEGEVYEVDIYSDYGAGSWWKGTAARNVVVTGLNPFDEDTDETHNPAANLGSARWHEGQPDWWREFVRRTE